MIPRCICFLTALCCTAGCTSTHMVDSGSSDQWLPDAQEQLVGEDVRVRTTDGRAYGGTLSFLSADSIKVWDSDANRFSEEALTDVTYVGRPSNATAPILGCIGGAVLGGFLGGALSAEEPEIESLGVNTVESAAYGGIIGALIGGTAGAIIGGVASRVDQYEISHAVKREEAK